MNVCIYIYLYMCVLCIYRYVCVLVCMYECACMSVECVCLQVNMYECMYTGCPRRKGPNFGRVFLRSNYTDITQNTYIQSSMVTEILAREV